MFLLFLEYTNPPIKVSTRPLEARSPVHSQPFLLSGYFQAEQEPKRTKEKRKRGAHLLPLNMKCFLEPPASRAGFIPEGDGARQPLVISLSKVKTFLIQRPLSRGVDTNKAILMQVYFNWIPSKVTVICW